MNLDDILDQALTDFENQNTKYGFKNEKPKLNSIINNDNNLKSNLTNSNVLNTVTNQAPSLFHPSPSSIDITGSNLNTKKVEEVGQQLMEDMINQFEELGKREDYDDSIDGVMKQLLSKDMMYEPAKMICERYPEWLALHKEELPPEKYEIYGKQYQTFQRIVAAYELEPDNYARLMELMIDLQQYEQPPADIIKDLAPGLKFDENGIPIMPNMGAGMFPGSNADQFPDFKDINEKMETGQCLMM